MEQLDKKQFFGAIDAMVHVVVYQKRGLPHAHILLIPKQEDNLRTVEDYDSIVCAELPHENMDPMLHKIAKDSMMHGPCGAFDAEAPCTKDGRCKKGFPKDYQPETMETEVSYPVYQRCGLCNITCVLTGSTVSYLRLAKTPQM